MKTILVTGGAGFIGSNFIKMMLKHYSDYKIINMDCLTYAGNLENLHDIETEPNYKFIKGDIRNREDVYNIFEKEKIDCVVNFAAESHVDRSIEEPEVFLTTNVIGTQILLDAARKWWKINPEDKYCKMYKHGVKFVQISTDEVYGALGSNGKFLETTPLMPNSPYASSKASADTIVRAYGKTYGLPVNITRCSNNYGPYQFPEKLIPLMINNSLKGKKLPIYGDGLQVRDWLHVQDHCRAIDVVLHKGEDGAVYNIGGNNEKTNIEVVRLIIKAVGKTESLIDFVQDRPGHDRRYAIDNTKITTELGWKPAYSFEKGIQETIQWYLDYRHWIETIVSGEYINYYNKMYVESLKHSNKIIETKHKNIAFIPLRGGSKSIPKKNIKRIHKRPLVYWVLDQLVKCKYLDEIYVATDCEEIRKVVKAYGEEKITVIDRSEENARDHSPTEAVMLEFSSKYDFDHMVLVQATSPLLEEKYISEGFKLLLSEKYDSVLSAVRQKRFIWEKKKGGSVALNYDINQRPRRQDFEGFLVENGAFYITTKEGLEKHKNRLSGKIGIVEMPEETYAEIDEMSDWMMVEKLLKKRENHQAENKLIEKLKRIKLVITDCDGVLTDGGMYYSESGDELKKFNTRDGMGIKLLRKNGIETVIITGENVDLVRRRGEKLGIKEIYLGVANKEPIVRELSQKYHVSLDEIAYVGDDINDYASLRIVGLSVTVQDGAELLKKEADIITRAKGGKGALREIADRILECKGSY